MHEPVCKVCKGELSARGSQVPLLVVVALVVSLRACCHSIGSDVKFALVDQQRIVNVLLDDASFLSGLGVLYNNALKFAPFFGNLDARTAVGALTRLRDPYIVRVSVILVIFLEGEVAWILKPCLYMKGDWKGIERVLTDCFVIAFHIYKEGLFVAEVVVVLDFVRLLYWENV